MISVEFLSSIPIFKSLSEVDLRVLAGLWKPRNIAQGETLFRKGDSGTSMFIVRDGIVEISIPSDSQHKDVRVSVLREGEFLGELSLMDGFPRTATAVAMADCRLLEMRREDFIDFLLERPSISISMISEIGKRLRTTNELVTSLASRNINQEIEDQLSFGEHLADKMAEFGGSWGFLAFFGLFLLGWMAFNTWHIWFQPLDTYPFIFLNLILSCLAAIQAPVIMMSQNRAQKKDRLRAELDYQVNLKSELMLQQLHAKIDEMRATEMHMIVETLQVEMSIMRRQIEEMTEALSSGTRDGRN